MAFSTVILSDQAILKHAIKANAYDPYLVLAIAKQESSKRPLARSWEAKPKLWNFGLMQLQEPTARTYGFRGDAERLMDWKTNIQYASQFLNDLNKRYDGDQVKVIASYNAGSPRFCTRRSKTCARVGDYINKKYIREVSSLYFNPNLNKKLPPAETNLIAARF